MSQTVASIGFVIPNPEKKNRPKEKRSVINKMLLRNMKYLWYEISRFARYEIKLILNMPQAYFIAKQFHILKEYFINPQGLI